MVNFLLIFGINLAWVGLLIAIHELGHYLAGCIAGIPPGNMRIRLWTFPQHVALRDVDVWVTPFDLDRYREVMRRHLWTRTQAFAYVGGGFVLETIFTATICPLARIEGMDWLALLAAGQSLATYLIYVGLMDLPMTWRTGQARGDTSGLWQISRPGAILATLVLLGIRLGLLAWVLW